MYLLRILIQVNAIEGYFSVSAYTMLQIGTDYIFILSSKCSHRLEILTSKSLQNKVLEIFRNSYHFKWTLKQAWFNSRLEINCS